MNECHVVIAGKDHRFKAAVAELMKLVRQTAAGAPSARDARGARRTAEVQDPGLEYEDSPGPPTRRGCRVTSRLE